MGCPECKHKLQVTISADDVSCFVNSLKLWYYARICRYRHNCMVDNCVTVYCCLLFADHGASMESLQYLEKDGLPIWG